MKEFIEREYYTDKIKPFIDKQLVKVIVGQRRVGKSYLLYQIVDLIKNQLNLQANIIFIDKEKYEFDTISDYRKLIEYVESQLQTQKKNYLFIDEIQDITDFEKALRHFYSNENIDIYCTGSNANLLSGELATYLSGRYILVKVYSLSYTEFLKFHALENTNHSLTKYMLWGGLPFIKNIEKSDSTIFEYLSNIYNTIIYNGF